MTTQQHFLDNLWRWKVGMSERDPDEDTTSSLADMRRTEWSEEFEQRMRNRLVFGAYRYGRMGHGRIPAGKPTYDRCKSIRKRLERFEHTGNAEWLVDIANLALLIYEERVHPHFHFTSVDGADEQAYHDETL